MKSVLLSLVILLTSFVMGFCVEKTHMTEFKPGAIWLDTEGKPINAHGGGVIFADGNFYWYGEHKIWGKSEAQKADGGIHAYKSKDLMNWEDLGVVLSVDYDNPDSHIAYGCILERPKVIYCARTKKYMAYFKLYEKGKGYDTAYLGVAQADSPEGPFKYSHRVLCAAAQKGTGDFFLFVDGNGDLWHLAVRKPDKAFCLTKFDEEYKTPIDSSVKVLDGIPLKTEAPAGFFKDGKFFLLGSGSSGWAPNTARLLKAESIFGPFEFLGNPTSGVNPINKLGPEKTFGGQSSFIIKHPTKDLYIAMFDMWTPEHPIEGKYIWLPITFDADGTPKIVWRNSWKIE